MSKSCSSRIDKGGVIYPCGIDCVRKEGTTSCSAACLDEYFYEDQLGICKLKPCDGRKPKSTNNNPCGYNSGRNGDQMWGWLHEQSTLLCWWCI
jgi:hypothetical protein